jgi:hypothetical protein
VTGFTVYYVVGHPRTGSSFVGDQVARRLDIVNAGEVWQTFRSVGLVKEPGFDDGPGRWARPKERAFKNDEIAANPFWAQVLKRAIDDDPYTALVREAEARAAGLVDCSKTDRGVARYEALGCQVVVIHTVRAFSSWAASMRKYQNRQGLPVMSHFRLLLSYLRFNHRMRQRWSEHGYRLVLQERLDRIDAALDFPVQAARASGQYLRAEMFGTPSFRGEFDPNRSTRAIRPFDRICYVALRIDPAQPSLSRA